MSDGDKKRQSPNVPAVERNNIVALPPEKRPKRSGIPLDVYVRRNGKDSGGRVSRGNEVVVVGICDYSDPKREPKKDPLPPEFRFVLPSEESPAVWLVVGWENKGGPYLVPEHPDGGPDLSRQLKYGHNLASTSNPLFWVLLGEEGDGVFALRICDRYEPVPASQPRLDPA